jgi:hypothetical protein
MVMDSEDPNAALITFVAKLVVVTFFPLLMIWLTIFTFGLNLVVTAWRGLDTEKTIILSASLPILPCFVLTDLLLPVSFLFVICRAHSQSPINKESLKHEQ